MDILSKIDLPITTPKTYKLYLATLLFVALSQTNLYAVYSVLHCLNNPYFYENIYLITKCIHYLNNPPASSTTSSSNLIFSYLRRFIFLRPSRLEVTILDRSKSRTSHPFCHDILKSYICNLNQSNFYWKVLVLIISGLNVLMKIG